MAKESKNIPKQPAPKVEYEDGRRMKNPKCGKCGEYPGRLKSLGPLLVGRCQHCGNAVSVKANDYR